MKRTLLLTLVLALISKVSFGQMVINDQSVIYQQQRMVFEQWNQNDFTPTHGFLWLNPLYWLTYRLKPGYPAGSAGC